jgi:hypothetical protein
MNYALRSLLVVAALADRSLAQSPAPPAKPTTPLPPITAKDVRAVPFCRELDTQDLSGKRGFPDELRVVTTSNKIHLYGKKREEGKFVVDGRPILHSGKLALLAPSDRTGKLSIKVPSAEDVTYYFAVLQFADGTLDAKRLKADLNKTYDWSVKTEAGQTTLRVLDGQTEVVAVKAPGEKVKGVGFASTVRWKGNESDLTFTVN